MTGREPVEGALMSLFAAAARRAHGTQPGDLAARVARRLEIGQARFGDSFRAPRWDGLAELLEELEDAVAYLLLEAQRLDGAGRLDPATFAALIAAGEHIFAADAHARQAIIRRAAARGDG